LYSVNSEQGGLTLPPPLLLLSLPQTAVDVVLGDSAVLSRQHCRITYNFQAKKWQLVVEVGAQLAGAGDSGACWCCSAGVFLQSKEAEASCILQLPGTAGSILGNAQGHSATATLSLLPVVRHCCRACRARMV
jgi:hypothetical protein